MLAIRLQRHGRKDYPLYRVAVQEAQRHPSSGRVVAYVGTYNPHTKDTNINVEQATKYLNNGAQPSPRVVKLLVESGIKMPAWVKQFNSNHSKTTKNQEKLRKNQPKVEAEVVVESTPEEATEASEV